MLVVLAIISVLTGVIFSSRSNFDNSVLLSNTAYDIALSIRNTQSYGIASRAFGSESGVGYGVHFAKGTGLNTSFDVFADTDTYTCHPPPNGDSSRPDAHPGDCEYDPSATPTERVQTFELNNGMTIQKLCVYGTSSPCGATSLDVVSVRPNTEWFFAKNNVYRSGATSACIEIESPQGSTRAIIVSKSGLITANTISCP